MGWRRWLVLAGASVFSVVGSILAFALRADGSLNRGALGLIVLIVGLAGLLALGAVQLSSKAGSLFPRQGGETAVTQGDRFLGGLLAVVGGLLAVVVLGVVTLALLPNAVAVATTAFGAISAVVGAYLGVKIGVEQGKEAAATARAAVEQGKDATATAHEAVKQVQAERGSKGKGDGQGK